MRRQTAFTLVELLTVIAIIGILAAILIPVTGKVRQAARAAQCRSNLHQIGVAIHLFVNDNKNKFPGGNDYEVGRSPVARITWDKRLLPYFGRENTIFHDDERTMITVCPSAPQPARSGDRTQYGANEILVSNGSNPRSMADVERPSEVIFAADALTRKSNQQAHAVLTKDKMGVGETTSLPDAFINYSSARDGEEEGEPNISYRHGAEAANVLMVDASVRSFKKGTVKQRNIVPGL
jgi:prepilin-type N-terminal cleavage/methylation domain-containing protein